MQVSVMTTFDLDTFFAYELFSHTAMTVLVLCLLGLFFVIWCVYHGDSDLETVCFPCAIS
jgi:hypothetical protein